MASTQKAPKVRTILGLMTFSPGSRITTLPEFNKCLDYFKKRGYNELDTARMYGEGQQEAFTAQTNWREKGFKLATKNYPAVPGNHNAENIVKTLEKSLSELKTDYVDIYYLHAPDRSVPYSETLKALDKLHKQGKFGQLGLSNYSAFEVAEIVMLCQANCWVRPTIYQGVYNAFSRNIEPELIPACRRYGLDIVVYSPLAGGLLAGRYTSTEKPQSGHFSDKHQNFGAFYRHAFLNETSLRALEVVRVVAKKHNLTLAEIALRWLVHHSDLKILPETGGHDGVIIGASSLEQIEQNLDDLEKGPLPKEVVQALDEGWLIMKPRALNFTRGQFQYGYDVKKELFGNL